MTEGDVEIQFDASRRRPCTSKSQFFVGQCREDRWLHTATLRWNGSLYQSIFLGAETNLAHVAGQTLKRAVQAGDPLLVGMSDQQRLVQRGQKVEAEFVQEGMELKLSGKLLIQERQVKLLV